jgi:hypothetical protein
MAFVKRNWFLFCVISGLAITTAKIIVGPSVFLQVCYLATLVLAPAFIANRWLVTVCIACALLSAAVHMHMDLENRVVVVTVKTISGE